MVDVTEGLDNKTYEMNMLDYNEQVKVVYPRGEEKLIDFLNRCKLKDYEVMLFPCCSVVFDKEASKEKEKIRPYTHQPKIFEKQDKQGKFIFYKWGIPHKVQQSRTYVPPANEAESYIKNSSVQTTSEGHSTKRPMKQRLFPPLTLMVKPKEN